MINNKSQRFQEKIYKKKLNIKAEIFEQPN